MPRPPSRTSKEKTLPFTVAVGHSIGDMDGTRRDGGDTIRLSKKQAEYYMEKGSITVALPEFPDDADTDEDHAEASAEPEADGSGEQDVGGTPAEKPAPKKRARRIVN